MFITPTKLSRRLDLIPHVADPHLTDERSEQISFFFFIATQMCPLLWFITTKLLTFPSASDVLRVLLSTSLVSTHIITSMIRLFDCDQIIINVTNNGPIGVRFGEQVRDLMQKKPVDLSDIVMFPVVPPSAQAMATLA